MQLRVQHLSLGTTYTPHHYATAHVYPRPSGVQDHIKSRVGTGLKILSPTVDRTQESHTHLAESSAIFSAPHLQQDTLVRRDILAPTVSCTQATSARTLAFKSTKPFWRENVVETVAGRQISRGKTIWKHNGAHCVTTNNQSI